MFISSDIRKHIRQLGDNEMFCNRHLLKYGTRALIDKILSDMCKAGDIRRLARGVYVRSTLNFRRPEIAEIAKFKAEVFGRRITGHMKDAAKALSLCDNGNTDLVYITDGYSTSFLTMYGRRVYFKRVAARKVRLQDNSIGTVIKAFWHIGKPIDLEALSRVLGRMTKDDRHALKRYENPWMPAWMSDTLLTGFTIRLTKKEKEQLRQSYQQDGFY